MWVPLSNLPPTDPQWSASFLQSPSALQYRGWFQITPGNHTRLPLTLEFSASQTSVCIRIPWRLCQKQTACPASSQVTLMLLVQGHTFRTTGLTYPGWWVLCNLGLNNSLKNSYIIVDNEANIVVYPNILRWTSANLFWEIRVFLLLWQCAFIYTALSQVWSVSLQWHFFYVSLSFADLLENKEG